MRILNIYVTRDFVSTAVMAVIIMTFGMMGMKFIKVFDALSKGISPVDALSFLLYVIPTALSLTIPFSVLVATMLVFGRLSANNEITAMRACGISVLQIISPIIILTFSLTCVCLYLQLEAAPYYSGKAKDLLKEAGVKQPLAMLEAGRTVQYEQYHIYIDDKKSDNTIHDIQVFILNKNMGAVEQDITATDGKIEVDETGQVLKIILYNATVKSYEKENKPPRRTASKHMEFSIDYGKKFNQIKIGEKPRFLTFRELFSRSLLYAKRGMGGSIEVKQLEVELNQRVALALSPIAFLLLGMPLAIRTSRKETSVGLFLSVILAGAYFIVIMILQALYTHPQIHPEILLWIPNVLYQISGIIFLFFVARR